MKIYYFVFILCLLLIACSDAQVTEEYIEQFESSSTASDYGEAFTNAHLLQLYFKEDQSIATFDGTGNEYASYTEKTAWLSDHYVQVEIDNGGSRTAHYYRLNTNSIDLLVEQHEEQIQALTIEQLDSLKPVATYLQLPIEIGESFDRWTITDISTITTPYDQFTNTIKLSSTNESGTEEIYLSPGYGIVKKRTIIQIDDSETVITSELKDIEYK